MTDFNLPIDINNNIKTTFNKKELILKNLYFYDGPITRQRLPYGGIQSIKNYSLIINCVNGFIASDNLIFDNREMTSKEFIKIMDENIVNQILPN